MLAVAWVLLPSLTALAAHLTRSHQPDKPLELVVGEIGADSPETTGYVFAHHLLAKRMEFGHAGILVGLLLCCHAEPLRKNRKYDTAQLGPLR